MQEPYQNVTFSQVIEGDDSNSDISRSVTGTRGEILTNLLAEFGHFLNSIGFSYVSEIVAVTDNGGTFSSND